MTPHSSDGGVDLGDMATPPRMILPGRTVHLTIQAVNRQYRFVPNKDIAASIRFIFWHCVRQYGMQVHEMTWMSNHAHILLTDVKGVLPAFVCQMNSLLSRQLNTLGDRTGCNIEKGYADIEIADDVSMERLCAYTLANPCAAGLVSTAAAWRGVTTYKLEYNQPFVVERPNCGMWREEGKPALPRRFRNSLKPRKGRKAKSSKHRKKPSTLPDSVVGVLTRPKIFPELTDRALRERIRLETYTREKTAAAKRKKLGKTVLGWKAVLRRQWNHCPRSRQSVFEQEPRIATECAKILAHKLGRLSAFQQQYAEALDIYIDEGPQDALFPKGTWKMSQLFNASCSTRLAC